VELCVLRKFKIFAVLIGLHTFILGVSAYGAQPPKKLVNSSFCPPDAIVQFLTELDTSIGKNVPLLHNDELLDYIKAYRTAGKSKASLEVENILMKTINDDPALGKAVADEMTHLYQQSLLKNLRESGQIGLSDSKLFNDWKSFRGIFNDSSGDELVNAIEAAIQKTNKEWKAAVKESPELYSALKAKDLLDPEKIFKSGFSHAGHTIDETSLVVRSHESPQATEAATKPRQFKIRYLRMPKTFEKKAVSGITIISEIK
jgi:hypothetical protein